MYVKAHSGHFDLKGLSVPRSQMTKAAVQRANRGGQFAKGPRYAGPQNGRPSMAKARFKEKRKAIPIQPKGSEAGRRYLDLAGPGKGPYRSSTPGVGRKGSQPPYRKPRGKRDPLNEGPRPSKWGGSNPQPA